MGNVLPGIKSRVIMIEETPETWRLDVVVALHKRYLAGNHCFGVTQQTLSEIVKSVLPNTTKDVAAETLWPRFAEYNGGTEVLAGLAVVSQATIEDKARFAFALFDFNDVGSLGYDETNIMLFTMLSGAVLMTRRGSFPRDDALEHHVEAAFTHAARDVGSRLTCEELERWWVDWHLHLCEERGLDRINSPMAFLLCFDLVAANMLQQSLDPEADETDIQISDKQDDDDSF